MDQLKGSAEEQKQEYKIVIIGSASVGKTCLIHRLVHKTFDEHIPSTVGMMFLSHDIEVDGVTYKIHIWDTAGQERLRAIVPLYYRDANGVILVYDITSRSSLPDLEYWYKDMADHNNEKVSTIIVGNKSDLELNIKVSHEEAKEFAKKHNSQWVLTSAKDGSGVEEAFTMLIKDIIKREAFNPQGDSNTVKDTQKLTSTNVTAHGEEEKKFGLFKPPCCPTN